MGCLLHLGFALLLAAFPRADLVLPPLHLLTPEANCTAALARQFALNLVAGKVSVFKRPSELSMTAEQDSRLPITKVAQT